MTEFWIGYSGECDEGTAGDDYGEEMERGEEQRENEETCDKPGDGSG